MRKQKEDDNMSKEDIIKMIDLINVELRKNNEVGDIYIPTTRLLTDIRDMLSDILAQEYGVFYV